MARKVHRWRSLGLAQGRSLRGSGGPRTTTKSQIRTPKFAASTYIIFCFSINLFWLGDNLQYCDDFCHTSAWISHRYTCVPSILNLLLHSLPTPSLLGCPRAPALGALLHPSNSHWSSTFYMVMYMFQCYYLKSSHPHLLLLSPKVCSLHLCLLCCPAYRIASTIFLNSIYIGINIQYLSFWLTSLCITGSGFIYNLYSKVGTITLSPLLMTGSQGIEQISDRVEPGSICLESRPLPHPQQWPTNVSAIKTPSQSSSFYQKHCNFHHPQWIFPSCLKFPCCIVENEAKNFNQKLSFHHLNVSWTFLFSQSYK